MPKLSNLQLLGQEAQFEMAPDERIRALSEMDIEAKKPRWAGVMAVFYPNAEGETTLVLILRKTYKGVHSNQVGFPGGKAETVDQSIKHTALRETEEEVGLAQSEIEVVKKLNIHRACSSESISTSLKSRAAWCAWGVCNLDKPTLNILNYVDFQNQRAIEWKRYLEGVKKSIFAGHVLLGLFQRP